jgi:hypothetical protein
VEAVTVETADECFCFVGGEFPVGDVADDDADGSGDGGTEAAGNGSDATVVGDDGDRLVGCTMSENGSDEPDVSGFRCLV